MSIACKNRKIGGRLEAIEHLGHSEHHTASKCSIGDKDYMACKQLKTGIANQLKDEHAQMSVEMAICLPIIIICLVIVVDVLIYMGQCARFDHIAPQEILANATSVSRGQESANCSGKVQEALQKNFSDFGQKVEISAEEGSMFNGSVTYTCSLSMQPWPLGSAGGSIFGISIPATLKHTTKFAVDPYIPGQLK